MGSPLTMVARERGRRGRPTSWEERGTEWDDIYQEIKKSGEKLSVTGARPRPGFNST